MPPQRLVSILIQEGDFTKNELEGTAILTENDTKERVLHLWTFKTPILSIKKFK